MGCYQRAASCRLAMNRCSHFAVCKVLPLLAVSTLLLVSEATCALQMTCAGELGRLLLDAYCADGCPADSEHADLVLGLLDHLLAKQKEFTSEGRSQAASEGCKVAQAALKWAKQQASHPCACCHIIMRHACPH